MNYLVKNEKKRELTEKDHEFLSVLFGEADGNIKAAGRLLELSDPYRYFARLEEEIIERARHIIALNSAKAAKVLVEGLEPDDKLTGPALNIKIQCAEKILDRVGIVKKEKLDINLETPTGIFILPAKRSENAYVRQTVEQAEASGE